MPSIPDVGPLALLIVILLSAASKFYWARRNHNWLTFADGMTRLGLAAFYLTNYLDLLNGNGVGNDQSRALARVGILAVFAVEAMSWLINLFKKGRKL
jgi:hypothetical protein